MPYQEQLGGGRRERRRLGRDRQQVQHLLRGADGAAQQRVDARDHLRVGQRLHFGRDGARRAVHVRVVQEVGGPHDEHEVLAVALAQAEGGRAEDPRDVRSGAWLSDTPPPRRPYPGAILGSYVPCWACGPLQLRGGGPFEPVSQSPPAPLSD